LVTHVSTPPPRNYAIAAPELRFWQRATWRKKVVPWLFVLPILLINVTVVLGPAISAVYYSMTDWSGIGDATWVGFDNYKRMLLDDSSFGNAFRNNLIWLVMFLTVPIAQLVLTEGWDLGLLSLEDVRRGEGYSAVAGQVRPLGEPHRQILLDFVQQYPALLQGSRLG